MGALDEGGSWENNDDSWGGSDYDAYEDLPDAPGVGSVIYDDNSQPSMYINEYGEYQDFDASDEINIEEEDSGFNWGGLWGGVKDFASDLWDSDLLWDGLSLIGGLFGDDDQPQIASRPKGGRGGGSGGGAVKHGGHGDALISALDVKRGGRTLT